MNSMSSYELNFLERSPLFDKMRDESEFREILEKASAKVQVHHDEIWQWLEEQY